MLNREKPKGDMKLHDISIHLKGYYTDGEKKFMLCGTLRANHNAQTGETHFKKSYLTDCTFGDTYRIQEKESEYRKGVLTLSLEPTQSSNLDGGRITYQNQGSETFVELCRSKKIMNNSKGHLHAKPRLLEKICERSEKINHLVGDDGFEVGIPVKLELFF